jgi:hypothetical protein
MGNNKIMANAKPTDPKFPMVAEFVEIKKATDKNKAALECAIKAFEKYAADCAKASANLTSDLQKCKKKLEEGKPVKPDVKK